MSESTGSYVELHCHSNYSMLDGASHPEELVARAKELGMEALAITDHDGLYGAVRFWQSAVEEGIRPIVGAEFTMVDGSHLVLLAENRRGYANLCRLVTAAHMRPDNQWTTGPRSAQSRVLSPESSSQHSAPGTQDSSQHPLPPKTAMLSPALLSEHAAGLICLSGCRQGEIARDLLAGDRKRARQVAERYARTFGGDGFWIELQHHLLPEDDWLCEELEWLADRVGIGCVATNDVHYAAREGHYLQDILVCIKNRTSLDAAVGLLRPNSEYHLKPAEEMAALFERYPGAVANTRLIAERCQVDLNFKGYRFPGFQPPGGETSFSYLHRLCHEGTRRLYQPVTPAVSKQLAHELDVIYKTGLAEYFLIVWDIMRYARENGIPGQGRGSAADSIVAYVLGITKVDPIRHNLLFERFLSEEMSGMPDIDIDFSTNHREEIIQYVYRKYGEEYTGMVCNVVTYRARNAIREVGKALGLPEGLLGRFAKAVNRHSPSRLEEEMEAVGLFAGGEGRREKGEEIEKDRLELMEGQVGRETVESRLQPVRNDSIPSSPEHTAPIGTEASSANATQMPNRVADEPNRLKPRFPEVEGAQREPTSQNSTHLLSPVPYPLTPNTQRPVPWWQLLEFCRRIEGFPRHLSIHVGGMLITATPLVEIAPLERATAPGRVVVQFNKDDVEDMGLIKMDLLGLRTLSVIHDTLVMIRESRGEAPDLDRISLDDPAVYDMLCEPDNIGVFQVESRAQSQTLPKMRPRSIEDLIVEISIIRPGPLQGNMVHPYLRRRQGLEEVVYLHPSLEPILAETLGVVLFQEQVIRVAVAIAGFTAGEADLFRRAMNRHRSGTEMARIEKRFIDGALRNGLDRATAETIFKQLAGFASYGFCKSHAAAFAKTAYDTAYLKLYYAPEFYAAILNNQPMGFYSPEVVANDAKRHGIAVLSVDVNLSRSKCTVEASFAIRLGFSYVKGLGEAALARLEEERERGPFQSLADFLERTSLPREAVENLIAVGAMDCFGRPRRELLWEAGVRGQGTEDRGRGTPERSSEAASKTSPAGTIAGGSRLLHKGTSPLPVPPSPAPALPPVTPYEETAAEYSLQQVATKRHAVELFRAHLSASRAVPCGRLPELPRNLVVRVGGLVVCEQAPPTAKGHVFLTLEDETGLANVILRPWVYAHFRRVLQADQMVVIEGVINRQDGTTNLMAKKVTSLHQEALVAGSAKRPHRR